MLSFQHSGQTIYESYLEGRDGVEKSERPVWVNSLLTEALTANDLVQAIDIAHKEALAVRKYDLPLAIDYALRELSWYEDLQRFDQNYNNALYNTGRFYALNQQWRSAEAMHRKLISKNIDSLKTARSYCELGEIALELNDPYAAVGHYQKGIDLIKSLGRNSLWVSKNLNLALIFEEINSAQSLANKLKVLKEVDSLLLTTAVSSRNLSILNNHYASYYNNQLTYDFEKSRYYYLKNIAPSPAGKDSLLLAVTYANLANLYYEENRDSTLFYLQQARNFSTSNTVLSRILNIESDYYLKNNKAEYALNTIHRGLQSSTGAKFDISEAPDNATLSKATDKKVVLWGLEKKANVFISQFKTSGDSHYLKYALNQVLAADFLADFMHSGNREDASKLLWRKHAAGIYADGVYAAYRLNDLELAFYFAEKKKAVLLRQQIIVNSSLELVPTALSQRLNNFNRQINTQLGSSQDGVTGFQEELYALKEAKRKLLDSLSLAYPVLANSLRWAETNSLKNSQKQLDKNTAVLHYLFDSENPQEQNAQVLLISNTTLKLFPLNQTKKLKSLLIAYTQSVSKAIMDREAQKNFYGVSGQIYGLLFPNELAAALSSYSQLIIIADGSLNYAPFESLVVKSDPLKYLIEEKTISYAQSLSFLHQNQGVKRRPQEGFLGIAPIKFQNLSLPQLPYTESEISYGQSQYSGRLFLREKATKRAFLDSSARANILHLATHAESDEDAWIAMQDSLVSLQDLYSLTLNSDLVVLSGCSTADGDLLKGEGIASLARGFFYAGANTVISTLWNANDKSTQTIMADFYKNMDAGMSKSKALQMAKITYLQAAELSEAAPYYWGPLVLIGDHGSLNNSERNWQWGLLVLLFISLGIAFRKKLKKAG